MLNFDWLSDVPLPIARGVFLALFVVIGLLVLLIPREKIYEGIERPRWYHNLKLWAWAVLAVIFIAYSFF